MSFDWILIIIFVFVTLIFLIIAFIFPEWVGISKKPYSDRIAEMAAPTKEGSIAGSTDAKDPSSTEQR